MDWPLGYHRPSQSVTETTEPRAVVGWAGDDRPIVLTLYGPDGEVAITKLSPKLALTLAQELLTRGVQAIKADWPG